MLAGESGPSAAGERARDAAGCSSDRAGAARAANSWRKNVFPDVKVPFLSRQLLQELLLAQWLCLLLSPRCQGAGADTP